jgi:integrase
MRRMEILSIRLEHIDLARRIIYIPHAKAGSREQPITTRLAEFLKEYLKNISNNQPWLFPAKTSKTGHTVNIEKIFRRVVIAADLDPKQVIRHTLRHTAITHLVQAGVDLPTVKRISGHKSLQIAERYSHQNGAHIQAAMDKLEQRYKSTQEPRVQHLEKIY